MPGIKLDFLKRDEFKDNLIWIMDTNERLGNVVQFYFIPYITSRLDTTIPFNSSEVRSLLKEIYRRGHVIGIHPGYETYKDPEQFMKSVEKFKQVIREEGINQTRLGGRQHFLMWDMGKTPRFWENAGLDYDSSLCFADKAGFRCGTCHEFWLYDCKIRRVLKVKEKPLIVMDCTIISKKYEGLGLTSKAIDRINSLKETALKCGGDFVVLWHNDALSTTEEKQFYLSAITQNRINNLYYLISLTVLIFSTLLFKKASGSLSVTKINMISWIFYWELLAKSFIASILVVNNNDNHYLIGKITSNSTRIIGWAAVQYAMIAMPIGMLIISGIIENRTIAKIE